MQLGMGVPKSFSIPRREPRIPVEVGVRISGHAELPGSEATFTQDISSLGARVVSVRKWKINDRLSLTTPTGSFEALARVAYCQPSRDSLFAVGLEFLNPKGKWIVPRRAADSLRKT
jgi:hypothetical protein